MEKSEQIGSLAKALVKVQSQLKGARQDSINPFFKSKYADLSSVWETCRALLAGNELAVIQTTDIGENHQLIVETTLVHSSGEWISGQIPMLLAKQDPQGIGSAITYGRRYGLSAIVGICPEDDDAELAMDRNDKEEPKVTELQRKKIYAMGKEKGYANDLVISIMIREFGTGHSKDLTKKQASELIQILSEGKYLEDAALKPEEELK